MSFQNIVIIMGYEIAMMAFVKEYTLLSVPNIYIYNLSFDNLLHVPYMMIEKIPGQSLERKLYHDDMIRLYQIERINE
jgi:hypothetical protein